MSIYEQIEIGKSVPKHEDYDKKIQAIDFWRRSYNLPLRFLEGRDAVGDEILPRHACEDKQDYKQRLQITKPRGYVQQIISQFNSFLYSQPISRDGIPEELLDNADLNGTSWQRLMSESVLQAQVAGGHILIPDTTAPSEPLSQEQARVAGVRPYVAQIPIETVINWAPGEKLLMFKDMIRYYNDEFYQDFIIEKNNRNNYKVVAAEEAVMHGQDSMPLVVLKPRLWVDSQAAKLAEIAQTIFNIQSVLQVELMNKTFSHHVLIGDFEIPEDQPVKIGQGKATVLTTSGAGVTPAIQVLGGSDVAQADSLRKSLQDEVSELYRTAALKSADPLDSAAPESGLSKQVEFQATEAVIKSLAEAAEDAENKLLEFMGVEASVAYPDDYSNLIQETETNSVE